MVESWRYSSPKTRRRSGWISTIGDQDHVADHDQGDDQGPDRDPDADQVLGLGVALDQDQIRDAIGRDLSRAALSGGIDQSLVIVQIKHFTRLWSLIGPRISFSLGIHENRNNPNHTEV